MREKSESFLLHTIVATAAFLAISLSDASALDLHDYWDKRCGDCHGHAADFARQFLTVTDGRLQGRHHADNLDTFLANHYLSPDLVAPVTAMLVAQVTSAPRFRNECSRCHESAAVLVRETPALRDGRLVSRDTGQPVAEFLDGHAGLESGDVKFFVDLLARVAREVGAR